MANTYTQLLIQFLFAVKHRESKINESIREPLEKYITGVAQNNNHKMLAIYCIPDHCHIFLGLHPMQSVSEAARDIKSNSSKWLNDQKKLHTKFNWQEGYGAFSYSKSQMKTVINYVLNQPEHHKKRTFKEEYRDFLVKFNIQHDDQYLFDWID